MPTAPPFYLDWTFWNSVVALLALALSQFPPIRALFGKRLLELEVHGQLFLTHMAGFPNAQLYVSLQNVGTKHLRAASLKLTFCREGGAPFSITSEQMFLNRNDAKAVLHVPTRLAPGEEWAHVVQFQERLGQQDNRRLATMRANLRQAINEALALQREQDPDNNNAVEADDRFVRPLIDLFNQKFPWQAGEFTLVVSVSSDAEGTVERRCRFTIYESDEAELRSYVNDYKFGFGPAIDHPRGTWVSVPLFSL